MKYGLGYQYYWPIPIPILIPRYGDTVSMPQVWMPSLLCVLSVLFDQGSGGNFFHGWHVAQSRHCAAGHGLWIGSHCSLAHWVVSFRYLEFLLHHLDDVVRHKKRFPLDVDT